MAGFNVSVPHALGREDALARVQRFLDDVRANYAEQIRNVHGEWSDNRLDFAFTAAGLAVRGMLVVEEAAVQVAGPLPLAALFFRGKIEQTIRQELEKLLA